MNSTNYLDNDWGRAYQKLFVSGRGLELIRALWVMHEDIKLNANFLTYRDVTVQALS